MTTSLAVLDRPEAAAALLSPIRARILDRLRDGPRSAAAVAADLGIARQKANYHVRELERLGLVRHVEDRRRGNCVERVVVASARRYVLSPAVLGELGPDGAEAVRDRFSSDALIAAAGRTVAEVGELRRRADAAGKRLATYSLETEVRLATPADQRAFADALTAVVAVLVARFDAGETVGARTFRFTVGGHAALSTPSAPAVRHDVGREEAGP